MSDNSGLGKARDAVTGLGNKFPVVREGLIMEGLEWLNTQGFRVFSQKFPQQAAWLNSMAQHNSLGTRLIFAGVGELVRNLMGVKDPNDIRVARIADFLVAAQNMIRLGPNGESAEVSGIQDKLLDLPADKSRAILESLQAMESTKRIRIVSMLNRLTPERIVNLLTMDPTVQDMLLGLGEIPEAERPAVPTSDPLLESLTKAADALQHRAEGTREGS